MRDALKRLSCVGFVSPNSQNGPPLMTLSGTCQRCVWLRSAEPSTCRCWLRSAEPWTCRCWLRSAEPSTCRCWVRSAKPCDLSLLASFGQAVDLSLLASFGQAIDLSLLASFGQAIDLSCGFVRPAVGRRCWLRSAEAGPAVGFVRPMPRRAGHASIGMHCGRGIEDPDSGIAARKGAPLVAVDGPEPRERIALQRLGIKRSACAPRTHDVDLCASDRAREAETFQPGIGAGDGAARASTSPEQEGLQSAARLKPWRRAFCAARALPAAVLGPVLARALRRLASSLRALVMPPPGAALGGAGQRDSGTNSRKLLALLHSCCPGSCPKRLDFVPAGAAAAAQIEHQLRCVFHSVLTFLGLGMGAVRRRKSPEGASAWPAHAR